jgi:hypothetical protein
MVTCVSSLTRLKAFRLGFCSPRSRPDRESRRLPLHTRTVLPTLTDLEFLGASEYLEDFISGLDIPQLNEVIIRYFNQLIWDMPQLLQFVSRTRQLRSPSYAELSLCRHSAAIKLALKIEKVDRVTLTVRIPCRQSDWQLPSLAQICGSFYLLSLSTLERLDIYEVKQWQPQDDMENAQWLEVLEPFTAVKNLYLSAEIGSRVAPALRELARETVTGVLPALQNLFLEGFQSSDVVSKAFRQFVDARQRSGRPVSVHHWERGDA